MAAALGGCGGDEEADPAAAQTVVTTGGGNRAPTISGAPSVEVVPNQQYSFTPTASDPDGDTLTFTATNVPAWATFNAATGRLSGTPTSAQVGTYANIRIGVSDGALTTNLAAFSISVVGTATGAVLLTWNPPTQNTDGSALNNLAAYRVYWGTSQNDLNNSVTLENAGLSSYVVEQLTPATWHFAVTAINAAGVESDYSNFASKQVL